MCRVVTWAEAGELDEARLFVGREHELAVFKQWLARDTGRLELASGVAKDLCCGADATRRHRRHA